MKINHRMMARQKRLSGQMGFSLFGNWYDNMTDFEVGEAYLKMFFSSSKNVNKKIEYDAFIAYLRHELGDIMADGQVEGLGLGIRLSKMSKSDVSNAADTLAELSQGRTPKTIGDFRQALVGEATATPFTDAIVDNAIVKGFVRIGDTLIQAGSSALDSISFMSKLNSYLPFILPVVGGYLVYQIYIKKFIPKMASEARQDSKA